MDKLVLGFDCGGTKTQVDVVCVTESGTKEILETFFVGGMNVNSFGKEQVLAHLADAFDHIGKERLASVQAIGFGAAGISNPLTQEVFLQGVKDAGCLVKPVLIGDHQAALWGAHGGEDGIILIAGTGSVCCGHRMSKDGFIEARSGGYGHLIDDEGSGYALGRDVLSAIVRAEDGRIPPTVMKAAVYEQLHISSVQELVGFVYSKDTGKKDIAALAPILELGLQAGEKEAHHILENASEELASLVVTVANNLGLSEGPLSFFGSVLTRNQYVRDLTAELIIQRMPGMRICPPKYDAAFGAALATGI